MLNICYLHNSYNHLGGEDSVVLSELSLLRSYGHPVELFSKNNDRIGGLLGKSTVALQAKYSKNSLMWVTEILHKSNPDLVHVHNFFPLLTPSIYEACNKAGVPIVQTLHNYRAICPGALLMHNGRICEKCITGSPYRAILSRCYRDSVAGSWAVARMVAYHRKRQTWQTKVDQYIALSEFAKRKFVNAGFPAEKIAVKPNFYAAGETLGDQNERNGMGGLFVGRLSREKGVATMLAAWRDLEVPLRVGGDGPLLEAARESERPGLQLLGHLSKGQVSIEMARAAFFVMPAECYENFPVVLAEAFAHGLAVVASRLGAMAEIVEDGITGLHFDTGNAEDLAAKVRWIHAHPTECRRMGDNARKVYEAKYTPERNYEMLVGIYQQAIEKKGKDRG